jgi:hypothetical protein
VCPRRRLHNQDLEFEAHRQQALLYYYQPYSNKTEAPVEDGLQILDLDYEGVDEDTPLQVLYPVPTERERLNSKDVETLSR